MLIPNNVLDSISNQVTTKYSREGKCLYIAIMANELLNQLGYQTSIRVGNAAFRVGDHPFALVTYINQSLITEAGFNAIDDDGTDNLFHCWLEDSNGYILDFTTCFVTEYVANIDAITGDSDTPVTWSPKYLYVPANTCSDLTTVMRGNVAGTYFYHCT